MTENEMFEKLQANLAEEIQREEERKKRIPTSIRVGKHGTLQEAGAVATIEAAKRLNLRDYAIASDPVSRLEFGSLGVSCMRSKVPLLKTLETLAAVKIEIAVGDKVTVNNNPLSLRQDWRPAADAGVIVPLVDPSGQPLREPLRAAPSAQAGRPATTRSPVNSDD
jgi:hypothetical protein